MTEFTTGIQNDAPNPNDPIYVDPNQWWYDMSSAEQDAYREKKVAKLREIGAVVGVDAVISHASYITPTNPDGINPTVWAAYNRIISTKGYSAKPVETLKSDLEYHASEVVKIEAALAGFAGVQTTE